jgi:hypothetical protein
MQRDRQAEVPRQRNHLGDVTWFLDERAAGEVG